MRRPKKKIWLIEGIDITGEIVSVLVESRSPLQAMEIAIADRESPIVEAFLLARANQRDFLRHDEVYSLDDHSTRVDYEQYKDPYREN